MKSPGKMNFLIISIILFLFGVVISIGADGLQGIDATDNYPNGCVSCHSQSDSGDYRLNTMMSEMNGHPDISKMVKTAPADCMMCHGDDSYGGKLSSVVHEKHFATPSDNAFVAYYGGDCLNCHSINVRTGEASVKSGAKNW
jgi:hypothetical protein